MSLKEQSLNVDFRPRGVRSKTIENKAPSGEVYTSDGEVLRGVHAFLLEPKPYDSEAFTKVFLSGWKAMSELSLSASKILYYMLSVLKDDGIHFNIKDCMEFTEYRNRQYVYKKIEEIKKKGIIRKDGRCFYRVNPNMFFNGSRIKYYGTR